MGRYIGNDLSVLKEGARIVHWVTKGGLETKVQMPDGTSFKGRSEPAVSELGSGVVQFERFGFVNIEVSDDKCTGWFTHK